MYLSWLPSTVGYTSTVACPGQGQVDVNLSATLYFTHSLAPSHVVVENINNSGNITLHFNDGTNTVIPGGTTDIIALSKYQSLTANNTGASNCDLMFIDAAHARAYYDNYKQQVAISQSSMVRFLWQFSDTTFRDSAARDQPAFAIGNTTQIVTSGGKFTGYLHMPTTGNENGIFVVPTEKWDLGSELITIDCWIRYLAAYGAAPNQSLFSISNSGGSVIALAAFEYLAASGGTWNIRLGTSYPLATGMATDTSWHHLALIKFGGKVNAYFDGVLKASTANAGSGWTTNGVTGIGIGSASASGDYQGDICEVRYARYPAWISNFVPPSQPYA